MSDANLYTLIAAAAGAAGERPLLIEGGLDRRAVGPDEIAAWHQMQKATPALADPFLAPEYAMAVGRFRPRSRVAVLTDGQSIVGFFPFEERRLGTGVPISGWLSACQGVVR